MSRSLVCLEDIQPNPDSAEFIAAYPVKHSYYFLAIAAAWLGHDNPTKLYASSI
jgi:hypothetical protein